MENLPSKLAIESLTIQGSLVGVTPAVYSVARVFGLDFPDGSLEAVINGIMAIMAIASVIMTFVGRLRAKQKIVV